MMQENHGDSLESQTGKEKSVGLWRFTGYFLKMGTIGFGGPVALAGYMSRDLVEERGWEGFPKGYLWEISYWVK